MPNSPVYFPKLTRRASYSIQSKYTRYKQEIREDCQGRCVYCDVHENELGGIDGMSLDHFRPKKLPSFMHLFHDPTNLLWTCKKCNNNKDMDWPALGTAGTVHRGCGYIDPFQEDRNDYFEVLPNGELKGLKPPADYMIRMLALNRPAPRLVRQKRELAYQSLQLLNLQQKMIISEIRQLTKMLSDVQDEEQRSQLLRILSVLTANQDAFAALAQLAKATLDFTLY